MSRTYVHTPEHVQLVRALPWQKTIQHRCRLYPCDLGSGPHARCIEYIIRAHSREPWSRRGSAWETSPTRLNADLRAAAADYNTHGDTDLDIADYDDSWCLCCGCHL